MIVYVKSSKNKDRKFVLAEYAEMAGSFFSRFLGLMFRKTFGDADGLVLKGCGSIHTFFMRFPIDVVFMDKDRRVSAVRKSLAPWRIFIPGLRSAAVIELPAGTLEKYSVHAGDTVIFL